MSDYERTPESVGLELLVLNAIRVGLVRIDRKPKKAGRQDIEEAIETGELTWRDSDTGPVFTLGGKEYAVDLEVIPLNAERN